METNIMDTYFFYSKNSSTKESIYTTQQQCLQDAINYFAKIQSLPVQDFLKLYNVEQKA